jgi:hypothetical protein
LPHAQEGAQSGLELKEGRPMVSEPERARKAMIGTAHELASRAGLQILQRGGNAVLSGSLWRWFPPRRTRSAAGEPPDTDPRAQG